MSNDFKKWIISTSQGDVRVEESYCSDLYLGTKEALIELGLAKDGWFPNDNGNNKTVVRIIDFGAGKYEIVQSKRKTDSIKQKVIRINKYGKKFEISLPLDDEKQKERTVRVNKSLLKRRLGKLAVGEDQARFQLLEHICQAISILKQASEIGADGYHFNTDFIDEISDITDKIFHKSLHAEIRLDAKERKHIENNIKCEVMGRNDDKFSSFLDELVTPSTEIIESIRAED